MIIENFLPTEASRFLEVIGKDPATTRFRAIANPSTDGKGAIKSSCDPQRLAELSRSRFGMYVVINNGKDEDSSILSCPALFIEHDDLSIEQQAVCWKGIVPEPTIQVSTGGKSLHQYWVFENPISPENWLVLQEKLIIALKSDPSVKNLSRVMRLPGYTYYNKKGEQGPAASIYACSESKYKIEELEQALACISVPKNQDQGHSKKVIVVIGQQSGHARSVVVI